MSSLWSGSGYLLILMLAASPAAGQEAAGQAPGLDAEVDRLLAGTQEAARPAEAKPVFSSGDRALQALNPEISVIGDVWATLERSDGATTGGLRLNEIEFAFESAVDPFTIGKVFVGVGEDGVGVEEGYLRWNSLLDVFSLRAGRFLVDFGLANRLHAHSQPAAGSIPMIAGFLGEEGMKGDGVALTVMLPPLWASFNELTLDAVADSNDVAFTGDPGNTPLGVGRLTSYYDLTPATYLEIGLSGAVGRNMVGREQHTYLAGGDVTLAWDPAREARTKGIRLRAEALRCFKETGAGRTDSSAAYWLFETRAGLSWTLGLRGDYAEDIDRPERSLWGVAPVVTFLQSEFVRLRAQYTHQEWSDRGPEELGVLSVTFGMGPHRHDTY